MNKREEKKTRKNQIKFSFIKFIGLVLVCIYIGYTFTNLVKQPTETFMIEEGALSLEESVMGYVIRNEKIIEGDVGKGEIKPIISEGSRVTKNQAIFSYMNKNEEELTQKIKGLDEQIQVAMDNESQIFSSDIKTLNSQIEEEIVNIKNTNDIQKLAEYKKNINKNIEKKAKISGELSASGSYIKKLIEERTAYEIQLNKATESVKSTQSGIVSYRIDDLENILTPEKFSNINKSVLNGLKLQTGQIVSTSKNKAKIIDNYECYIASIMDSEKSQSANVGDKVELRLNNSLQISATIEHISEESDDSRVIIFKIRNNIEVLANYRKISLDVIWWNYKGLKVPNGTLLSDGDKSIIIRTKSGYNENVIVKVLRSNERYSIIDNMTKEELGELRFIRRRNKKEQHNIYL
jgi:hypothetical protein